MLMSGTLTAHLEEVDRSAHELFDRLMVQMARRAGITEDLKASNQMAWVKRMNIIRACEEELVSSNLKYS